MPRAARTFALDAFPTPRQGYDREDESQFRASVARVIRELSLRVSGGLFVNVKEEPYSAKGDGSTDDTDRIQAAIDDVYDAGGGVVFFPLGTYMASQVLLQSEVTLLGAGWAAEIKQIANSHTSISTGGTATSGTVDTLTDTGIGWTADEHVDRTIVITSGTGADQTRRIQSNTTEIITIEQQDPWDTNPDATSVYAILEPMPLVALADGAATEHCRIVSLAFDGNADNQLALNDGIALLQDDTGGHSFETNDPTHVLHDLKIRDTAGNGFRQTDASRENLLSKIHVIDAGMWGFECRGTDNMMEYLTAESCRLDGFNAGDSGSRWFGCKAFGCDKSGWLVFQPYQTFHGCWAQDCGDDGWRIYNCGDNLLDGCVGDRNGTTKASSAGFFFEEANEGNCTRNVLKGCVALNQPGGALGDTQDYAVNFAAGGNAVAGNWVEILSSNQNTGDSTGAVGRNTLIILASDQFANDTRYAELLTDRIVSVSGEVGEADSSVHFRAGREGSPAADNYAFDFKTSDDDPPNGVFLAYDNTDSYVYAEIDTTEWELRLGNADVPILPRAPIFSNATRPAAGRQGRFIWNSDDGNFNLDDGSDWILPDGTVT